MVNINASTLNNGQRKKNSPKKSKSNLFCKILINIIIHVHTVLSGGSRLSDKGGGEGGSHPDPEIRGGPVLKKFFFGSPN